MRFALGLSRLAEEDRAVANREEIRAQCEVRVLRCRGMSCIFISYHRDMYHIISCSLALAPSRLPEGAEDRAVAGRRPELSAR